MKSVLSKSQEVIRKIVVDGPGEPRLLSVDFQNEYGEDLIAQFQISADRRDIAATVRRAVPKDIPRSVWELCLMEANRIYAGYCIFSFAPGRTVAATHELSIDEFLHIDPNSDLASPILNLSNAVDAVLSAAEKRTALLQRSSCDA